MVTATGPIPPLGGIAPTTRADEVSTAAVPPLTAPEDSDVAELSRLGALLGRLTDLQRTDPEQARHALLAMASELSGRASRSGGDTQLRALSDAFNRAAQTGDLSTVRPPGPPRADELIEDTAPNTATTQGQVASYALSEPPAQPQLESLLEAALSRAEVEQRSADRVEDRRAEQAEAEQRRADRSEERRAEEAGVEQRRAERAEERRTEQADLEDRRTEQVEQRRLEQADLEERRAERADFEQRSAERAEQRRLEQADLEQRHREQVDLERRNAARAEQRRLEQVDLQQRGLDTGR